MPKLNSFLFVSLLGLLIFANPAVGQNHSDTTQQQLDPAHLEEAADSHTEEKQDFDAGAMILHHIQDAHEIHLMGDFAIYLPVIVKSEEGIDLFSSSHFYHNEKHGSYTDTTGAVQNYHYFSYPPYVMYHEHIYMEDENGGISFDAANGEVTNASVFDLSITKSVAGILLTSLIMILLFGSIARSYKKRQGMAPKGTQSFFEPLILFIRDEIAVPSIGEAKADRFTPFLLTIFFFIWIANMLGLIPFIGGFNITGTISVTLVLAAIVFVVVSINGNRQYWGHIIAPPGVPFLIKVILVPIEFLGIFIRPAVLMIRLTANITAGHILILALVSLVLIFGQTSEAAGYGVGIGSTLFMIFMYFLELLVAFLQAFVFTILAALYFGDASQEAHH